MNASTVNGTGDFSSTLTPADPKEMVIPGFFTVGALVVLISEVVVRSRNDIGTLRAFRGEHVQNGIYVLSRIVTLGYIILLLLFQAAPLGPNCNDTLKAASGLYMSSIILTTLLFYHPLRVVYSSRADWHIPPIYGLLSLSVVACSVTPTLGLSGVTIGTSKQCTVSPIIKDYVAAALIGPLLEISVVFILIACRRVQKCEVDFNASNGLGKFIVVDCPSVLSRGFVMGGQGLILISILIQLISLILFLLGGSITARVVLIPLNLAILNISASRVFILSQTRKLEDEKERQAKILRALGVQNGQDSSTTLGGITITQTVERFA